MPMELQELIRKLDQIEEQAKLTLDEYPKNLTKERLRQIISLAAYIRTAATMAPQRIDAKPSENDDSEPPRRRAVT